MDASSLYAKFTGPIVEAVRTAVRDACGEDAIASPANLKPDAPSPPFAYVGSTLLISPDVALSFALGLPAGAFARVVGAVSDDISDRAVTFTRALFDVVTKSLRSHGLNFHRAIPTVLTGDNLVIRHVIENPTISIAFSLPGTPGFVVELTSDRKDA